MANIDGMVKKQADDRDSIILQLLKLLFGLWGGFDRWDDVDVVTGMAARSATLVDAANRQSRLLTRSFQMAALKDLGVPARALPSLVDAYPRANTNGTEVYSRPVEQFIWARRQGLTFTESKDAFEKRMRDLATQDVKLADRDEAQRVLEAQRVTRWRRVIHPELSKSGTCGLCIVASQQVYTVGTLMSMHGPSCNCTVMGITKGSDPGLRLNKDDLKTIYAAAGSTRAAELQNTRITIDEHGELGPVLVKQGDHFKTAAEAGRPAYVKPTPATIRAAREVERAQLLNTLASAQTRYDGMTPAGAGQPPGGDEGVALFRAIRNMKDRITTIDNFLKSLPN